MSDSKSKPRVGIKLNSGEFVARSCLQGQFLSPLLCIMVVNELIEGLSENSCYKLGYADDIVS